METRAQFFMIAAVIIAAIIASIAVMLNYAIMRPTPIYFYDMGKTLQRETVKIIDAGILEGKNSKEIEEKIEKFINKTYLPYMRQREPAIELIYIYGNETSAKLVNYGKKAVEVEVEKENKTIEIVHGAEQIFESEITLKLGEEGRGARKKVKEKASTIAEYTKKFAPRGRKIILKFDSEKHEFEIKGDQQFFAILKLEREREIAVTEID